MTTAADFRPTHVVPQDGLLAWEAPDVNRPTAPLDALLPVQLVDRLGDWARIVCANDWSAWVDGRLLIAVPSDPPAAGHPLTRTADPAPLLTRAEEALGRYRRATEELASGGTDGETFRSRTRGLRVGVVVDGESMWLYDAEHERWVYCDGTRLSTYAAAKDPGAHDDGAGGAPVSGGETGTPDPTQVVAEADAGRGHAPYGEDGTRRVAPVSGGGTGSGGVGDPEPTQVVEAARDPGQGDAPYGEDGTRRVPPVGGGAGGPEPTQVVEAVADPGEGRAPYGEGVTRRIPPFTGDPDPAVRSGDA
ncbi:hypothetical protein [Streptomyces sp. BA2]|uniref:hypothetical protein n=1 Tax=Streptomyces sp. BA2 TaxID=436595 RepID=UPI0030149927